MRLWILICLLFSCSVQANEYRSLLERLKNHYNLVRIDQRSTNHKVMNGEFSVYFTENSKQLVKRTYTYCLQNPQHSKVVFIIPTISGVSPVEKKLFTRLCDQGFTALLYSSPNEPLPINQFTTELMNAVVERYLASLFFLTDWLKSYQYNVNSMGVVGGSQGGIRASILYALDTRFKRLYMAVTGMDIPYIYTHSSLSEITRFTKDHMQVLGISERDQYQSYLEEKLDYDPDLLLARSDLSGVAMNVALNDKTVPTLTQLKLLESIKNIYPKLKYRKMKTGHILGVLSLVYYHNDVIEWMNLL